MTDRMRGTAEMSAAMLISGTIGWFGLISGQPVAGVVFWRCIFGTATLLVICSAMGLLGRNVISRRQFALAAIGGVAILMNWLLLFSAYSRASISTATAA